MLFVLLKINNNAFNFKRDIQKKEKKFQMCMRLNYRYHIAKNIYLIWKENEQGFKVNFRLSY